MKNEMLNVENGGFAWENTTVYVRSSLWNEVMAGLILILWNRRVYLLRAPRLTAAINIKHIIPEALFAAGHTPTAEIDEYLYVICCGPVENRSN